MKKIIMGIIWFILLQFVFGIVGGCTSTYIQRAMGVAREDVNTQQIIPFVFILALLFTLWGTATGKLPGTKSK